MTAFLLQSFKIALRELSRNKPRSLLTMLGIIVGVMVVIVMVAVGQGVREGTRQSITRMGSRMLVVLPGSVTAGGVRFGGGTVNTLTVDDARAIQEECWAVEYVSPGDRVPEQAISEWGNWRTTVAGCWPSFLPIREWNVATGRCFNDVEEQTGAKVCIVGQTVCEKLFANIDPIGQLVRIRKVPLRVIGVLERKGHNPLGVDEDDTVIMPLRTFRRYVTGSDKLTAIMASTRSEADIHLAERQIRDLLRQRHRLEMNEPDDFDVRNLQDVARAWDRLADIMTAMLGATAGVSLIVGGIGIMNIMLVAVTERTREIGIRMAIGASERHILMQFLVEAVCLSITGGVFGIIIGIGGAVLLRRLLPVTISLGPVALAFGFAAAVGIIFGFLPARRAARLNPIEALRHD
jgi:putative ABC transport system permease protein